MTALNKIVYKLSESHSETELVDVIMEPLLTNLRKTRK